MPYRAEVFISYAHSDKDLMISITKHLNALVLSEHIRPWTDQALEPGELWEPHLRQKLQSADIIIPLISADYWSSNYAATKELSFAIERGKQGLATVVPIILKPCMWRNSPIADFMVLPMNGVPLSSAPNLDEALAEITEQIYEVAKGINENASRSLDSTTAPPSEDSVRDLLSPRVLPKKPVVTLLRAFPHPERVLNAAFNRTGSKFATACDDGRVRIFSVGDRQPEVKIQARPRSLRSVSWSWTGREIATGDSDGSVRIWRDGVEKRHLPVSNASVWDAEYSLDGKALVVASDDGDVSVWNPRRPQLLWKRQVHERGVNSVRFSYHGNQIVTSSSDGTAGVLDTATGRELFRFAKHNGKLSISVFVSTDLGQETSCVSAGEEGGLLLWSTSDTTKFVEISRHSFWVQALACSVEGDFVVSGGYDAAIKFIDLRSGSIFESMEVDQGPIYCVRISFDGSLLLVSAEDCNTYLFSLRR